MSKVIFFPLRFVAGLAAGAVGKRLFRGIWGLVDDQEAPKPDQRRIALPKLALALLIEGALFRVLRGLADHGSRRTFAGVTGAWPGEQEPKPEHGAQSGGEQRKE